MRWLGLKRRPARRVYGAIGTGVPQYKRRFKAPRFKIPWRRLLVLASVAAAFCFVFGTGVVLWVSRDLPDPNKLKERQVAESTKIYDRTGTHLLYEVYQDQKRTIVPLDQISPLVVKATIAVEDKYFYEHRGIRLVSIARAAFNNLIGRKQGAGGASTMTQQLIKKTVVGDERRGLSGLGRKIKEAILAIRLERKYTKDQIVQLYLNEIPYGSTNYGVEAAAQTYFRKSAKDVTLAEAATLAAMINRPSFYLNNRNALRNRRDVVLRLMQEQGYITLEEKTSAQNEALRLYSGANLKDAPHFVLYVKQLLADQFGESAIDTGGLRVITTLDYDKQKLAEQIIKEQGDKYAKESNADNAALVAIDPQSGQILALVGSRDYNDDKIDGQFNVAVSGRRQPGSSFKPFVYTLAFQKGYTPATVVYDVQTDFDLRDGNQVYSPKNYDGKEHGLVTFRSALQGSLNIPAVKVLYLVGPTTTIEFAKNFGYTTFGDSNLYGLSLVLGGAEVNLLEHTNAYATLANNGGHFAPEVILKVTNVKGEVLKEWQESEPSIVVAPEIAATITNVLSDDAARGSLFGTRGNLTLPDRAVAAKTGTTNDNKDAWTLGYVPSLAAGVWVGNTAPKPMKGGGNALAGKIWNLFMRGALASTTPDQFLAPPSNDATKPALRGYVGGIRLPINKITGKIAISSTPEALIEARIYLPQHDILHYVNKDDPRGPVPSDPYQDGQYQNWENALIDWVSREAGKGRLMSLQDPPTEYDDSTANEFSPTIKILAPTSNQVFNSRQLNISVAAGAPRGVASVIYSLDSQTIGESKQYPFNLDYYMTALPPGEHVLKAVATDEEGAAGSDQLNFYLRADYDTPNFDWLDQSPLNLTAEDFPRAMLLKPYQWDNIKDIQIYLKTDITERAIFNFNHAEDKVVNGQLMFTWRKSPGFGSHTLRAVLTDKDGRKIEKVLNIEVK
ncbi:MAG: penicillin-binding protein [Candidatus Magasanikbacteria bacterium]|nr:penicillin-binding protein [Candidatus Magasanikbacteria bacterium]